MNFRPIDVSMKTMVESYTKPWKLKCSEYTFTNLLIWGAEDKIKLAEENDVLFFLLDYGEEDRLMFAPLTRSPESDYRRALDTAAEFCLAGGIVPEFRAISGPIKDAFARCPGYSLAEDRDNFDYIYRMEDLRDLSGKKLHAKRNHINQFMAQYGQSYEYVRLNSDLLGECMALYNEWLQAKDAADPDAVGEYIAIRTLITHMDALGVVGAGIRVDGKLKAYTMGERIDGETAVVHIEKADTDIPGLFTVINNLFVKNEFADMKFINREEDMGLEGLRRAKLSYNPVMLIEKYVGRPL